MSDKNLSFLKGVLSCCIKYSAVNWILFKSPNHMPHILYVTRYTKHRHNAKQSRYNLQPSTGSSAVWLLTAISRIQLDWWTTMMSFSIRERLWEFKLAGTGKGINNYSGTFQGCRPKHWASHTTTSIYYYCDCGSISFVKNFVINQLLLVLILDLETCLCGVWKAVDP